MPAGSVIASSDLPVPAPSLRGYALVAGAVVIGDDGMRAFDEIVPGVDGAYTTVIGSRRSVVIGTDAQGYGRLFLYRDGSRWAAGSSLVELAEFASARGWPLTVDRDRLLSFALRGPISNQLTSFSTVFAQITTAPAAAGLRVRRSLRGAAATVDLSRTRKGRSRDGRSYAELLKAALDEITGTLRALMTSSLPLVSDITGGRDSRAVLAALLAAAPAGAPAIGELVRFKSGEQLVEDFAVASSLSDKYGLGVNRPPESPPRIVDPRHGYEVWRANDLGVYGPIYPFRSVTEEVGLSGAGGESHRLFYKRPLPEVFRAAGTDDVPSLVVDRLAASAIADLGRLAGKGVDERVLHYRNFRDRFHGGRNAVRTVAIAPLASTSLRAAADRMPAAARERGQVLADILLNLAPELVAEPFDTPAKAFDEDHLRAATRVEVDPGRLRGAVHGVRKLPPTVSAAPPGAHLAVFAEAFAEAAGRVRATGWLPDAVIDAGASAISAAVDQGRFAHAVTGQPVSLVILAGEAARLATR